MILLKKIKEFYHKKILKKKYYRLGKCIKCGCCCENIYIRHQGQVIRTTSEFEKIKKEDPYSFYQHITIINQDDFGLVFACDKFDKEKRLCLDHKNRPRICRNYPSEEIFSFGAQLQEQCGFKFVPIESFSSVLRKISKKQVKSFKEAD